MSEVRYFLLFLVNFYGLAGQLAQAQPAGAWHLKKNKDHIQVYSRHVAGSSIAELKVECLIPGTKNQLVALLSDVANYHQVIYGTKKASVLKRLNETQFTYYIVNELPWPAKDRDMAVQLNFAQDSIANLLRIQLAIVPHLVPVQPDLVRIVDFSASWQVHSVGAQSLKITYICRVDPGGSIPAAVENFVASTGAYNSFILIRDGLRLPRYQGRKFTFIRESP